MGRRRPGWTAPIDEAPWQVAERHGLDVVLGKLVWELRPAVRSNKGEAVRRIINESNARSVVVVIVDRPPGLQEFLRRLLA